MQRKGFIRIGRASAVPLIQALLSVFILFAAPGPAAAQDALTKLRAEYAAQINPVDKAKTLAKLAPHEMTAAQKFAKEGEDEKALAALQHYRDEVVATTGALMATGADATRRPGGFRELQISLRMMIRRLDDMILSAQQDARPGLRDVRADIEMAQNALIDALFPPRPAKRPPGTN